ncbi:MAG: CAP domain-containing protein [Eubacteriales bacterium]|nr:CAP domain-containing protein [Eubacteriales bacterium]
MTKYFSEQTTPPVRRDASHKSLRLMMAGLLVVLLLTANGLVQADQVSVTATVDYSAAHRMLDLINAERAAVGLNALSYNYNLEYYAKLRAAEVSILNAHLRADGSNVAYSENYSIGWGSADSAHSAFMNSAGHRANILNPNYTTMAGGVLSIGGKSYWVQVFTGGGDPGSSNGMSGSSTESFNVTTNGSSTSESYSNLDDKITIKVGNGIHIDAGVNGQIVAASWSSDNTAVATVDASGYVSAVGQGVCLITGKVSTQTVRIQVTVVGNGSAAKPAPQAPADPLPDNNALQPAGPNNAYAPTAPSAQVTEAPNLYAPTAPVAEQIAPTATTIPTAPQTPTAPPAASPVEVEAAPVADPSAETTPSSSATSQETTAATSKTTTAKPAETTKAKESETSAEDTKITTAASESSQALKSFPLDDTPGMNPGLRTALIVASASGIVISLALIFLSLRAH